MPDSVECAPNQTLVVVQGNSSQQSNTTNQKAPGTERSPDLERQMLDLLSSAASTNKTNMNSSSNTTSMTNATNATNGSQDLTRDPALQSLQNLIRREGMSSKLRSELDTYSQQLAEVKTEQAQQEAQDMVHKALTWMQDKITGKNDVTTATPRHDDFFAGHDFQTQLMIEESKTTTPSPTVPSADAMLRALGLEDPTPSPESETRRRRRTPYRLKSHHAKLNTEAPTIAEVAEAEYQKAVSFRRRRRTPFEGVAPMPDIPRAREPDEEAEHAADENMGSLLEAAGASRRRYDWEVEREYVGSTAHRWNSLDDFIAENKAACRNSCADGCAGISYRSSDGNCRLHSAGVNWTSDTTYEFDHKCPPPEHVVPTLWPACAYV